MTTRILTQVDCENRILQDLDLLSDAVEVYDEMVADRAYKEARYKRKKARCFQQANGSVRDKEAFSDVESADEHQDFLLAEAKVKAQKELLSMLHARLDNMRSLNANVRSLG